MVQLSAFDLLLRCQVTGATALMGQQVERRAGGTAVSSSLHLSVANTMATISAYACRQAEGPPPHRG
jgi:hypothetical protein